MYGNPTCKPLGCVPFDPEGLVSSLGAIATCFFGLYFGYVFLHFNSHTDRLKQWIPLGILLTALGFILHVSNLIPLNTNLYSISYLLFTAGFSFLFCSIAYIILDVLHEDYVSEWPRKIIHGLFMPFICIGMNSIAIYVGDGLLPRILGSPDSSDSAFIYIRDPNNNNLLQYVFKNLFLSWLPHDWAILLYSCCDFIWWSIVAFIMYKRGIFIKL